MSAGSRSDTRDPLDFPSFEHRILHQNSRRLIGPIVLHIGSKCNRCSLKTYPMEKLPEALVEVRYQTCRFYLRRVAEMQMMLSRGSQSHRL